MLLAICFVVNVPLTACPSQNDEKTQIVINGHLSQIDDIEKLASASVPEQIAPDEVIHPRPPLVNNSRVVQRKVAFQGGRTVTTLLMDGPPPAKPVQPPVLKEQSEKFDSGENKRQETLFLSNTVYGHTLTEMRWTREGRTYRIFSNIDFTVFRGLGRIVTANCDYSLVLGIGEEEIQPEAGQTSKDFPSIDFLGAKDIQIHLPKDNPPGIAETPEYKALGDILEYYAANENELRWNQAVLKAENAARQRWREAHPVQVKDATVRFWPVQNAAR